MDSIPIDFIYFCDKKLIFMIKRRNLFIVILLSFLVLYSISRDIRIMFSGSVEGESMDCVEIKEYYSVVEMDSPSTEDFNKALIEKQRLFIICLAIILITFVSGVVVQTIISERARHAKNAIKVKDETRASAIDCLQEKIIELQEVRAMLSEKEEYLKQSNKHHIELREELTLKEKELRETMIQKQELKQRIFDMNEVVKKIRYFKKQKKVDVVGKRCMLDEEELSTLSQMINFCYNDVITRISEQYPELGKDDLNLCSLLCLEVSNSKIALLLNISDDALKQRKSRLKRYKLGLMENETLENFLSSWKGN